MAADRPHRLTLLDEAAEMIAGARRADPHAAIYQSIEAQLRAIEPDVRRGGPFDPGIQARVNIGLLAVREFEQSDPEYAEPLVRIAFLYQDEGVSR